MPDKNTMAGQGTAAGSAGTNRRAVSLQWKSKAGCAGLALLLALPLAPRTALAQEGEACEEGTALLPGLCAKGALIVDGFANLRGGKRRDVSAFGQLTLGVEGDLGRMGVPALEGWSFGISTIGIFGRQPTQALTGSLAPVSGAEALSTFRLNELWVQRQLGEFGSLRIGQLTVDGEFATSETAGNLVNATFGWPVALATSLSSGGAAYPLAAPGIRLELGEPETGSGVRMGLYAGDPGGKYGEGTDPQRHNRYGTNFSFTGGRFVILEAVTGGTLPEGVEGPRPWVAKLGIWHHSRGDFRSQRFTDDGLSLADPAASGNPRRYRNDQGIYGVGDATLWRGETQNVTAFARGFAEPGNRNEVAWQVDAGLSWANPLGQAGDIASLGVSYDRIGHDARRLDADVVRFGDASYPRRDGETVIEANYEIAVVPGRLTVKPMAQWILHPGAGAADDTTGRPLRNAFLAGLRLKASF
jgi:porin